MNTDDPRNLRLGDQARLAFDDAPERFRDGHASEQFSGSSGVLFEQAMAQTRMAICLCDPNHEDLPIVFANRAFRALTGYSEEEIIGNNCRFLQGPDTDPEPIARIRDAIVNEQVVVVELLNYRKNGTSFWNALHLGPIYNDQGELIYFFGSQWDVSGVRAARAEERHAREMARELSHRMKNMFAVISSIVNVTGRMRGIRSEADEINARIQALGRAYETTLDEASVGSIDAGQAISAVLGPYSADTSRLVMHGDNPRVPFGIVSIIGLVLHELAANAAKYGAWAGETGKVEVDWSIDTPSETLLITWQESGGAPVDAPAITDGVGSAIVNRMLQTCSGTIERRWELGGLHATLRIPVGKS